MTAYQVTLPDQLQNAARRYVTLVIPPDSPLPAIDGQWCQRDDDVIEAWYTRQQLREAVCNGLAIKIGQITDRLDHGEILIAEAKQRGDVAEAERLERYWVSLLEQITRLLGAQVCAAS